MAKNILPTGKDLKNTGIDGGELLGGFIGGHGIRSAIKSDKKWINPVMALLTFLGAATLKNKHAQNLALGAFVYSGVKSLNDLKTKAVEGLEGVEGMEGVRDILNKIVPNLGDAEPELLSGEELARAEADLLGLLNGSGAEFTPYSEVQPQMVGMGSVSNL